MVRPGVSIVIPAFNEERAIAGVLEYLSGVCTRLETPSEIIVVDDGSSDATAEQVDAGRFRLVRHGRNRGYGAAIKSGVVAAQFDVIVITDADGTYPCDAIPGLVAALADCEMAVAARTGANVQIPALRRPAKWVLGKLANYLTGHRIPDLNSGQRAIRRELFEQYARYYPDGFSLTTTITLAALTNGHRVEYIPIDYHARIGSSKIRPIYDTLNFIQLIVRTVLYFEPLKIFVPASLALILAAVVIGAVTLTMQILGHGRFMDVTTLLLFVTGLQLFAIGALADLITKRLK